MTIRHMLWAACAVMVSVLACSAPAQAQARTWVSGVGDDANLCSRTSPCKTFAGAIAKTVAGGEISVLDPGSFGAVTITKSISIVADGQEGGITASSATAILINAGASDVVQIKGLTIEGGPLALPGAFGIRVQSAKSVYVSNTTIRGFLSPGPTGCGVSLAATAAAVRVFLRDVQVNTNRIGVCVTATGGVTNSIFIENSTIEGNSINSLSLAGASASAVVLGSVMAPTPVSLTGGASLSSTGNNRISGGVGPTSVIPLQ